MTSPAQGPRWCSHCNIFEIGRVCFEIEALARILPDEADRLAHIPQPRTDDEIRADVLACIVARPGQGIAAIADAVVESELRVARMVRSLRFRGDLYATRAAGAGDRFWPGAKPRAARRESALTLVERHGAAVCAALAAGAETVRGVMDEMELSYSTVDTVLRGLRADGRAMRSRVQAVRVGKAPHVHAFRWTVAGKGRGRVG